MLMHIKSQIYLCNVSFSENFPLSPNSILVTMDSKLKLFLTLCLLLCMFSLAQSIRYDFKYGLGDWKAYRNYWTAHTRATIGHPLPGFEEDGFAVMIDSSISDELYLGHLYMPLGGYVTIKFFGKEEYIGSATLTLSKYYEGNVLNKFPIDSLGKYITPTAEKWVTVTIPIPADSRTFGVSSNMII